jgi:hypothetical protein
VPTAGSAGALRRTRSHERVGRRHRADASPRRHAHRPSRRTPQPVHVPQPRRRLFPTRKI